jgi:hypothetical protein
VGARRAADAHGMEIADVAGLGAHRTPCATVAARPEQQRASHGCDRAA